jgi:hypothetical protein
LTGKLSAPNQAQGDLLALLRTKGLSIKELDEGKKAELRELMDYLHNGQGLSLNDIAKLIGNKTSGYTSWLCRRLGVPRRPFEEARLKGIREKRRKYERKPFDGTDEDKAYLLGLRHGDLSASRPWKGVVRISTSTTHPAMAQLFHSLFEPFGHVYQHPRYKKETQSYEWNLSTILDSTFDFLLQEFEDVRDWIASDKQLLLSYLAGLLDAEGSFVTTRDNRGLATVFVDYNNSDKALLDWVQESIRSMGFATSLRINKRKGVRTKKYGIVHRTDYWQLSAYGAGRVQELVELLKVRHPEKIRRRQMALKVVIGKPYTDYQEENELLRASIKAEVRDFVRKAEEGFLAKHPGFLTP